MVIRVVKSPFGEVTRSVVAIDVGDWLDVSEGVGYWTEGVKSIALDEVNQSSVLHSEAREIMSLTRQLDFK
jgi:hypothetical protein